MPVLLRFDGAVAHEPEIDRWLASKSGELGAIARVWFDELRRTGTGVLELMHDGCPTVCVRDAGLAYVNVFKKHVGVGFFQGASLPDPAGLLEGTGKYMRHVKLRPGAPVDAPALRSLIAEAYRDIVAKLAEKDRGAAVA